VSPTIRISQGTYDHLKEHAEPFVDTPDSVIRRLLGLATEGTGGLNVDAAEAPVGVAAGPRANDANPPPEAAAANSSAKRRRRPGAARVSRPRSRRSVGQRAPRAPRGSLLAEDAYEIPILQALADHGGRAGKNEVLDALESRLGDQLTELDRTPITSGEVRWRNRAQFVRLRLVERGEIKRNSPRGIWELSDAGNARLREVNSGSWETST
jgi:hypothetical protein